MSGVAANASGLDVESISSLGSAPCSSSSLSIAKLPRLDAGATITARDDEYRSTPLAWAARANKPQMVEFLLSRRAPVNLPDDEPWATPLAWAERRGHQQIASILRAHGATR